MKLDNKKHKINKIKNAIKNNKLIFFMTAVNLKRNLNFKSFFVKNLYFRKILKKSIYSKLSLTINGIINLVTIKNFWDFFPVFEKSLNPKNKNVLIAIKMNDKIYSKTQLKNIKTINYAKKVFIFYKTLKCNARFYIRNFISK